MLPCEFYVHKTLRTDKTSRIYLLDQIYILKSYDLALILPRATAYVVMATLHLVMHGPGLLWACLAKLSCKTGFWGTQEMSWRWTHEHSSRCWYIKKQPVTQRWSKLKLSMQTVHLFLFCWLQLSTYLTAQANGMRYFPNLLQNCLLDFSIFCAY